MSLPAFARFRPLHAALLPAVLSACGGGGSSGDPVQNYSFVGTMYLTSSSRTGALNMATDGSGNASGSLVIDGVAYSVHGRVTSTGADLQFGSSSASEAGGSITGGSVLSDGISNAQVQARLPVLIWPNANVTGYLINGTGSYSFTLGTDGSGTGTVTVPGGSYAGSGRLDSRGMNFSFGTSGGANGTITGGSASATGVSNANWTAHVPATSGASTLTDYSGVTQGTLTASTGGFPKASVSSTLASVNGNLYANGHSNSSAGSGSSSGNGSSTASCGLNNYVGPKDDIQTYSFCQEAYVYKCAGDTSSQQKTCNLLNSFLQSIGAGTAHNYCSNYC